MLRRFIMSSFVLLLQGGVLHAQEIPLDLRGATVDDPAVENTAETGADSSQSANSTNALQTRPSVVGLRSAFNSATAEEGSTGLGTAGRVVAVSPFSDRLAAVQQIEGGTSGISSSGVFDGETTFDQPEGIRLGTFTILPELNVTGGWTDNASGSSSGSSSYLYRISPSLQGTSDWSRHQLDFALRGSFVSYPGSGTSNTTSGSASTNLLLDLSDTTKVNGAASYSYSREDASSAENTSGDNQVHQLSGSLGVSRNAGLLSVSLKAGASRTFYTSDTASASAEERNNTLYTATLRLDSNGGGVFAPFAESSLLLRRFDDTCIGGSCENRNSNGYQVRGGFRIANGPKLSGEIGAGWRIEKLDDSRLEALEGFTVDGSLVWSPSKLTTVTAGLGTSFEPTNITGVSGSIIYSGDLRLAHAFSDRFVGEAGGGYSYRTYQGSSSEGKTLTGFAGATYAVTRNVALKAKYSFTAYDSSSTGADYTENRVEAGVRIRR